MDFNQTQAYLGFWVGAVIVTCTQNMITSIISYKARKTHASSILKILFNFSQIVRNIGAFGLYMTPAVATLDQCAAFQYLLMIGNNFTRLSLIAFLLWRIRQINVGRNNTDNWICIVLFVTRIAFSIPYFVLQRISTVHNIESDTVICGYYYVNVIPYNTGGIATEIIIDIYVTHRLVHILKSANKNASRLSPNVKGKRTLFTAVIYWNFLRLIISFIFHFMGIYNMLADEVPDSTLISLSMPIYILLSYVITIDAEIVRAIEGKGQQDGKGQKNEGKSKSKIVKTIQSIDDHISSSLSSNDQTHSQHIYSSLSSSDQTNSQIIDDDKIVVVSMKRLSFFEWANFVIGDEKDENDENDGNDENDENDENTKNNERKNNFSNDTLIKTSNKDNVDIIIH